jgi:indole-3-glycerol phosphate synthase
MNTLESILEDKFEEVNRNQKLIPFAEMKARCKDIPPTRNFTEALRNPKGALSLIAEVKRASPSKGIIREDFNPVEIANIYASNGAVALSILTDKKYFQGKLGYVQQVKDSVNLPLLRKDFIIDEYQIYESRVFGADAILLIASSLSPIQIQEFYCIARSLDLSVLVEAHNETEALIAIDIKAEILGINNRDLSTFITDLAVTESLAHLAPKGTIIVSESGIRTPEDIQRVKNAGASAVLIGESLMRAEDIGAKTRHLLGLESL